MFSAFAFAVGVFTYSSQDWIVLYIIQMYSLVKFRLSVKSQPLLVEPATPLVVVVVVAVEII